MTWVGGEKEGEITQRDLQKIGKNCPSDRPNGMEYLVLRVTAPWFCMAGARNEMRMMVTDITKAGPSLGC